MPRGRHKFLPSGIVCLFLTTIFATVIHHAASDDGAVMAKLAQSISPTPAGWTGPNFCKWPGVACDTPNKVSSINLSSKSLTGTLPPEINQLSGLKTLSLQRNKFSGPLPALSNLGSLEEVNLDDNGFTSIPPGFLSGLTSLQSFSINNNINLPPWTMPTTLKDSTSLTSFVASKANIVGEIPDIFGSLPNLASLRLSYNNMTGWLPWSFAKSDLSECTELNDLQLRGNQLTGVIPDSLTKLPKLQNVALQNNVFQGPMPSFQPGVQVNLGNSNHFCLPSPGPCNPQVTVMLEIAASMYYPMDLADAWEGNDACQQWQYVTCEKGNVVVINFAKQKFTGIISPRSLTNLKQLQILDVSNNNISGKVPSFHASVTLKLGGNPFIGKNVAITYPGGRPPPGSEQDEADSSPIEVLREATDNFSEKSILGRGGFGIVYKGELSDGTKLAVKRMEASMISGKGLHEFKAEIEVLTSVRHRNLVSLHGWNQRVTIALDVARGVEYLHSMANQSFIHRDLKPTNILLGEDMRAKVCDFGLVRQAPDSNCSFETRLAGTFGYLAPEYAATGRVTTKVDVYAFGVVLMELVTGRKSLDSSLPDESSHLVTWFRPLLHNKDNIREALDPALRTDLNEEIFESMWKVAQLAGHCTRESSQRPDMSHAVTVLSSLVEQWNPASVEDSFIVDFSMMSLPQVLQKWKNNEETSLIIATDYINQKKS